MSSTGTNRPDSPISACPTGPVANFTNSHACCLRELLAAMARPVVPMLDWAPRPLRANGQDGDVEVQDVGAAERLVSPVPAQRHGRHAGREQVHRGDRLLIGRLGRHSVLARQVRVELHALDERVVVEIQVRWVGLGATPRSAVVHAEQPGRVIRDPGVHESPLGDLAGAVALGQGGGGGEEVGETPRLFPPRAVAVSAPLRRTAPCCRTRNSPTIAPVARTGRRRTRTCRTTT